MIPLGDDIPTRRFPAVTVGVIAINIAVWVFYELPQLNDAVRELGFYPCEVNGSCSPPGASWPLAALAAMFMHASWLHIGGNMLFLWIFGNNVEDAVGRVRYGAFYLVSGFVATAAQTFVTVHFGTPSEARIPNIGASGAIAGVLGAYLALFPQARIRTVLFVLLMFGFVEVPAFVFLGIWFLFQLWQGGFDLVAPNAGGGVAFFAHVGGFLFGMATAALVFRRGPPLGPATRGPRHSWSSTVRAADVSGPPRLP